MNMKAKAGMILALIGEIKYDWILLSILLTSMTCPFQSYPFGWEPDADGFRGHIYVSEDNSTVVLSIKGTSLLWLIGDGGPTVKKDRLNDNLLFSCCCARVGPTWSTVCDCHSGGYKCDTSCLSTALMEESLFYNVAVVSVSRMASISPCD